MNDELQLAFTATAAVPIIIALVTAAKKMHLPTDYAFGLALVLGPLLGLGWAVLMLDELARQTVGAYVIIGIGAGVTASKAYDELPEQVQAKL